MTFRGRVIIVTGSRKWTDEAAILARLRMHALGRPKSILLHGGADGADSIAANFGRDLGFQVLAIPYFADLGSLGGHARNQLLVDLGGTFRRAGYEVVVEAFPLPGSVGTYDCIECAETHFLTVVKNGLRR